MPAVSKAQGRMMCAICHGSSMSKGKGISKRVACEYCTSTAGMPEHVHHTAKAMRTMRKLRGR